MEVELEPRVRPLGYKVKAMSRESPSQKAAHVLDTDLRNHWSTATNTKEWILLELDEPCLLSHIRIYNKSVLEWEISVGLRYKPETFVKVRPRCEAPRRDMMYPMNYTPCRYVRISCLRGNPIAIFYIQLMGLPVPGLEPEFQPVVNHLLPNIISHKQDGHDVHLQLLQDMTNRLVMFLPQLEADLNSFSEAPEPTLRFLTMLAGPFYPILQIVNERETARLTSNVSDSEASKNSHPSTSLTVSSNFEPRRLRNSSPFFLPTSSYLVFRPDVVFTLLRKAYKDSNLGNVCRMASKILLRLMGPITEQETSSPSSITDEASKIEPALPVLSPDYSELFGEEFRVTDDKWDSNYISILDIASAEEGILHILYACASQPLLCSKLADVTSDFWSALPLVQALLPALRPSVSSLDQIDENFSVWKQPFVQHALSEIVATSSSPVYRPLLRACAGYLSSYSPSHAKAACVLIDLCSGVLAPWIPQVIAKVDLVVELLEDLLGVIQATHQSFSRARAAVKYMVLALSGNMDDIMSKYKEVKQRILFLMEMLEPYLDPAITPIKSTIAFGNMSSSFLENQERICDIALNVMRTAVRKCAVLPSLEAEWRQGSVAPSVLLSILEPHLQFPPDIDLRKCPVPESQEPQLLTVPPVSSSSRNGGNVSRSHGLNVADGNGKTDTSDISGKVDTSEDASLLFAPPELCRMSLTNVSESIDGKSSDSSCSNVTTEVKHVEKSTSSLLEDSLVLDAVGNVKYLNLKADYGKLTNYRECELRATEFRRLAHDLHSQSQITPEGHDAAVDSLLLAAECYVNPYFLMSFEGSRQVICKRNVEGTSRNQMLADIRKVLEESDNDLKMVADLERKRDKIVLEILLEAAELDKTFQKMSLEGGDSVSYNEGNDQVINLSQHDILSADAITLVRQNQALLCNFLVQRLQRDQHSMHEILMQSLLFFLNSASRLYCSPECIVDIILKSAEYFNGLLTSLYYQFKEGTPQLDQFKLLEVQRRWMLLQRLVIASSGGDEALCLSSSSKSGFRFANLIPPSAWLEKVPVFSSSASPLVRFLGWMAVSRNAKQYLNERLFLASDLSQLSNLLSIYSDELALVDNIIEQKYENKEVEKSRVKQHINTEKEHEKPGQQYVKQYLHAIYPDISHFFPNMKKQFETFGEIILEAVGLQLRSIPSTNVPDMLCWFSDLCSWPFVQKGTDQIFSLDSSARFKGFVAKNAKAIILYILEAIVTEHMEAMVPEIPRLVQVLLSLCRSKYCDVSFLDSILRLLKPIISYSLQKVADEETTLIDDSCLNFESLCFDELFDSIKDGDENQDSPIENRYSRASAIFVLASVFPDLSVYRSIQTLKSSIFWAEFASFEPTTSFHDYLCAYQVLIRSCKDLLIETLRDRGVIPLNVPFDSDSCIGATVDDKSGSTSWFLGDICQFSSETGLPEEHQNKNGVVAPVNQKACRLTSEEIRTFCQYLESLISKLNSSIELCCKLHHKLASKLACTSAECFVYLRCLSWIVEKVTVDAGFQQESLQVSVSEASENESRLANNCTVQFPDCWRISLEGFAEKLGLLLEDHCWEVASMMLDCLLEVSRWFCLDNVIGEICCALKNFSCRAPNIAWRQRTDKWMSLLFTRGMHSLNLSETPLIDLFCALLAHPEPEQRFIALKHMSKLVGQNMDVGDVWSSSKPLNGVASTDSVNSASKQILSSLVLKTWDQVALLASSDISLQLRTHAMALLMNSIPFAERHKLQSFLASADRILQHLTKHAQPKCEGPLTKVSLALVASVSLYSPAEDVYLIPENVWRTIETLGEPRHESCPAALEQKICQALCRIKNEGEEAKQSLKEVLSSSSSKQQDPDFGSMRESILQVVANLSSTQSYFDFFAEEIDQKAIELEEAEMEMELLQSEHALQESSKDIKASTKDDNRLQQIKDEIRSLEKAKLREEIIARRQKKLVLRHARQKYLEEAASREAELLQQLDRERTAEVEREIERQRLLELERAKTRELRYNLDMEKEKQTQRDLQRELEQVESGLRPSRREFSSSTHSSRPRERYRERENGRAGSDGNLRAGSGSSQPENLSANSSVPKVVLSGARQFSGQLPTILQQHDRLDEWGSSYEENFDGSRDSGDTGSIGDPEMVSTLEGQSFSSAQRHGSRGNKSRQIMERRERDGRREGKWERKH